MQDRYTGDVGDFGKYGLLRALVGIHPAGSSRSLGVVWYVTDAEIEDVDPQGDGRHLSYLEQPARFRECDPQLFSYIGLDVPGDLPIGRLQELFDNDDS